MRFFSAVFWVFMVISLSAQKAVYNQFSVTPEISGSRLLTDTLFPGNSASQNTFVLIADSNGGYVIGTDSYHNLAKGQQFRVDTGYVITGAIYWFGAKQINGNADSIKFSIWQMDKNEGYTSAGYGFRSPGTVVRTVKAALNEVDTSKELQSAHAVTFDVPLVVVDDYVIGFDLSEINDDLIGLMSTENGAGGGQELVWEKWKINQSWHTLQASGWGYPAYLDVDAMILPIVDLSSAGIVSAPVFNGLRCSAYPVPAGNSLTLKTETRRESHDNFIEIMDNSGKSVMTLFPGIFRKGTNTFTFSVNELNSGNYIAVVYAGKSRYALRFCISR